MKPFNLQAALAGSPVVTVGSRMPVTGLHRFDGVSEYFTVFGVVDGAVEGWHDNGAYSFYADRATSLDLRMAEGDEE